VLLQEISLPKFQVFIFVPSTGILSATGFSGNGAALTSQQLTGTISAAVLGNSTFLLVLQQLL
jgi:hypothetical protein